MEAGGGAGRGARISMVSGLLYNCTTTASVPALPVVLIVTLVLEVAPAVAEIRVVAAMIIDTINSTYSMVEVVVVL